MKNTRTILEIILQDIKKINSLEDIQVISEYKYIEKEIYSEILLKMNILKARLRKNDFSVIEKILNKARNDFFINKNKNSKIKIEIDRYFNQKTKRFVNEKENIIN